MNVSNPGPPVEELIHQAVELIQCGQTTSAREILRTVLKTQPRNPQAWELLVDVCNNATEEIFCLERLLRLKPDHPWARQRLEKISRPTSGGLPAEKGGVHSPGDTKRLPQKGLAGYWDRATAVLRSSNRSLVLFVLPLMLLLMLFCVGTFIVQGVRAGLPPGSAKGIDASATQSASCQDLITLAVKASGDSCEQLGPNGVCYGNLTLQAEMVAGATNRFKMRGDQIPVQNLHSLSASPMNTSNGDWGIAIFRMMANLPRSLPGEMVTLFVFGNTSLTKDTPTLESFYFHSQMGRIVCDQVPFDGILVTLPEGAGVHFEVNGTDLLLMGNASLKAVQNAKMEISLFSGSARVTSGGEVRYFGAGKKVSVQMGGQNGDTAIGPPTEPQWLSPDELKVSCSLTGQYCSTTEINPVDAVHAQANVELATGLIIPPTSLELPSTAVNSPAAAPVGTLTPPSTPQNLSLTPGRSASPTASRTATLVRIAPSPTQTATMTTTSPMKGPTAIPTPTPTRTSIPPSATVPLPTPTASAAPAPTNTTEVVDCSLYTASALSANKNQLSISLDNQSSAPTTISGMRIDWVDYPSQKLQGVLIGGMTVWSGNDNAAPSIFPDELSWQGTGVLPAGSSTTLELHFFDKLEPSNAVVITFGNGCQVGGSN